MYVHRDALGTSCCLYKKVWSRKLARERRGKEREKGTSIDSREGKGWQRIQRPLFDLHSLQASQALDVLLNELGSVVSEAKTQCRKQVSPGCDWGLKLTDVHKGLVKHTTYGYCTYSSPSFCIAIFILTLLNWQVSRQLFTCRRKPRDWLVPPVFALLFFSWCICNSFS